MNDAENNELMWFYEFQLPNTILDIFAVKKLIKSK